MLENEVTANKTMTNSTLSPALKLEITARIGAVLLFAAPSLIPTLAPDWDWPATHHMLIDCGGIPLAVMFYAVVHALATRAAGRR